MKQLDPLLEEAMAAIVAMTALSAFVALLYWFLTGQSPWPYVVLAEFLSFGVGIGILTLTSPRRRP
jgi:hypothetical protein